MFPEQCDDFNEVGLDGCSKRCNLELGFYCTGGSIFTKDECFPICGDGVRIGTTTGYNLLM